MGLRVYSGGTFDIFHIGHVRLLRACRAIANHGTVVVSLNTDEFVREFKGDYPVNSYSARAEVLAACRYVDDVVPNRAGRDSKPAILEVQPDIIVIGDDWKARDYHAQMSFTPEWLDHHGIALMYVPYTPGVSSSALRRHIVE